MEVLGAVASGVTLAVLFKCTFEALDLIHLYQTQDVDFGRLQLQYKLEKCRLYNWGVAMGLADDSKHNLLSEWHSKELVAEALRQVIALFSDAQVISKKYGCDDTTSSTAPPLQAPENSRGITRAFNHFKINSSNTDECMPRFRKTKWVIRDRKKFLLLVSEVRSLIDSLEKITSDLSTSARLEGFFRDRINSINNVDTLLNIASVWKESHPRVASAASTKADSISLTSGKQEFISEWQNSVDSEASGDTLIGDIEDLTITELKHSVMSSKLEVGKLQMSLNSTAESMVSLQQRIRVLEINDADLAFLKLTGFDKNSIHTEFLLARSYSDPVPWTWKSTSSVILCLVLLFISVFIDEPFIMAIAFFSIVAIIGMHAPSTQSRYPDLTRVPK